MYKTYACTELETYEYYILLQKFVLVAYIKLDLFVTD